MSEWIHGILGGNRRTLARFLTMVENEAEEAEAVLTALFPHTGNAWVIGITGAPGTGKSSLVNALAKAYRTLGKTVGIIAVDPTSPFSGGAILGDRIRMYDLAGDSGVFIRSMATRGSLGGLARTTRDTIRVMDAAGFNVILVETVGAGQSEVDIVRTAQTTIVVDAPGLGDDVQAIKAGILEIADILVVNKADRPGAESAVRALRAMLELGHPVSRIGSQDGRTNTVLSWIPPVVATVAIEKTGIDELVHAIARHRDYLQSDDNMSRIERQHIQVELTERLQGALTLRLMAHLERDTIERVIHRIQTKQLDPRSAVKQLLEMQDKAT